MPSPPTPSLTNSSSWQDPTLVGQFLFLSKEKRIGIQRFELWLGSYLEHSRGEACSEQQEKSVCAGNLPGFVPSPQPLFWQSHPTPSVWFKPALVGLCYLRTKRPDTRTGNSTTKAHKNKHVFTPPTPTMYTHTHTHTHTHSLSLSLSLSLFLSISHTSGVWIRLFVTPCGPNGRFFGICIFPRPLGETSAFNSIGNSSGSIMWLHGLHQNHLEKMT